MEATRFSETSIYNKPTRRNIPEDGILHIPLDLAGAVILQACHVAPFYLQELALTSPTIGCRSVGIVHSWTQAMEFSF
jgi:hypothetical protein